MFLFWSFLFCIWCDLGRGLKQSSSFPDRSTGSKGKGAACALLITHENGDSHTHTPTQKVIIIIKRWSVLIQSRNSVMFRHQVGISRWSRPTQCVEQRSTRVPLGGSVLFFNHAVFHKNKKINQLLLYRNSVFQLFRIKMRFNVTQCCSVCHRPTPSALLIANSSGIVHSSVCVCVCALSCVWESRTHLQLLGPSVCCDDA